MRFTGVLSFMALSSIVLGDPTLYSTGDCSGTGLDGGILHGHYVSDAAGGCYDLDAQDQHCHNSRACYSAAYSFKPDQDGDWTIYHSLTCGSNKYTLSGLSSGTCYSFKDGASGVKHQ